MRISTFPRAALALLAAVAAAAPAADASLSRDGRFLVVGQALGGVVRVDLESATFETFDPMEYGGPGDFQPSATSNAGFVLGRSGPYLWAIDTAKRKCVKVWTAPKGSVIEDLAYDPVSGGTLVALEWKEGGKPGSRVAAGSGAPFMFVPKDAGEAGEVFARRVDHMQGMAFDAAGNVLFGHRGDLWRGTVAKRDDADGGDARRFVLTAERVAPVATHETDEGTPSGVGAKQVAAGRDGRVTVWMGRMGGSGWGSVLSMKAVADGPAGINNPDDAVDNSARRSAGWLKSLKTLSADVSYPPSLCSTADGSRTVYADARETNKPTLTVTVIDGAGAPRKVTARRR